MRKPVLLATAKSENIIEVTIGKDFYTSPKKVFTLYEDDKIVCDIEPVSKSESQSTFIYTLLLNDFTYVPGKKYEIKTSENYFIPLDISFLAEQEEFEKKYRFNGELGAIYRPDKTIFRVFSPFATTMLLKIQRKNSDNLEIYKMIPNRENGVFSLEIEGDLDEASYLYTPTIFGEIRDVVDPYSYSVGINSRIGYVINPEKIKAISTHDDNLPPFSDPLKAFIYECSVRDMTSKTSIPHHGTFSALSLDNQKDKEGNPIGLDYISSLGMTHVQLLPVLDFHTIDDERPDESYNWGYDPYFFFAPEGSYSLNPIDPYSRVMELRNLIGQLHAHGLRVVLDVVYNHVFCVEFNPLAVLVPKYYFRINHDHSSSNGSGCGNDFESRHYMARKLIIDSLMHLLDFYDVDGFRFDLLGILDVDTVNKAYQAVIDKKPEAIMYGEGWDLPTALPGDKKASISNSNHLKGISFFNDRFRDVVKGSTSSLSVKGYLSGDTNYIDGFKHVFLGSSIALAFAPLFTSPTQSINYIECHDNHTLYDKLKSCCHDETEEEIFKRLKLCNAATCLASGIPFFHAGQEVGLSKDGLGNTYNVGDEVNGFDYKTAYHRKDLLLFFKDVISFKKKFFDFIDNLKDVNKHITFENLDHNAIKINYIYDDYELYLIFNPTKQSFTYNFDEYVNLVFTDAGNVEHNDFYIRLAIINGLSLNIFLKNKRTQR